MAIVVESTASNNTYNSGSITITKPTSLAVGDLLIATISSQNSSATVNTLSGWTAVGSQTFSDGVVNIQFKVADSGDVAASNFTFSGTGFMAGGLMRVSGVASGSELDLSDSGFLNNSAGTTLSVSSSETPSADGSLVVICGAGANIGNTGSVSSYNTTPSLTFTEVFDATRDAGSVDPISGAGYSIQTTATEITAFGITFSVSKDDKGAIIAVFTPVVDASASTSLHEVSPTFFAESIQSDFSASTALHEVSPTFFTTDETVEEDIWTQQGKSTAPIWTEQPKS